MSTLDTQLASYLTGIGIVGLVLGWWLGRWRLGKTFDRASGGWVERLAAKDAELEGSTREVRRLAAQVQDLGTRAEESAGRAAEMAASREDWERQLAEERDRASRLALQLAERDAEHEELRDEISRCRDEASALAEARRGAEERSAAELDKERDRSAGLEAAAQRSARRIADLESALARRDREQEERRGEHSELAAELARLRSVKEEFQEWLRGAARREEELSYAKRQLGAVGTERDALRGEVASLAADLAAARRDGEARDAVAATAGGELARARQRIGELEAAEGLASRLAAEIEELHAELEAGAELERELRRRAQAAETARLLAAEELEAVLSSPLADVGRMATSRADFADAAAGEAGTDPPSAPELLAAPRGAADDLKRIRGIGPVLERVLNSIGVYHFRQIASWSPSDVSWAAAHVNTFPDRIERDGWIAQAEALTREPGGEEE